MDRFLALKIENGIVSYFSFAEPDNSDIGSGVAIIVSRTTIRNSWWGHEKTD